MIIWFIGMSDSGKTTLAHALHDRLKQKHGNLVCLDGDKLRSVFGNDVGHSIEGRRKNAERISRLCHLLDEQGIHVICSILSIFPVWQKWNRENFSSYYEIFLDIPMSVLKQRDNKQLYQRAEAGEIQDVVGVDIPFPRPPEPDLVVDDALQEKGIEACRDFILIHMPPLE